MTSQNRKSVQSILRLTGVFVVGWVIAFWPARMSRPDGVQWMSVAACCCMIPGWLAVVLERVPACRGDVNLMLGQMGIRFFAVMVAAVTVKVWQPEFGFVDFYGWLVGFYLLAMVTEVIFLREKFAAISALTGSKSDL